MERVIDESDRRPRKLPKRSPVEELIEDTYDSMFDEDEETNDEQSFYDNRPVMRREDFSRREEARRRSSFDRLETPVIAKKKRYIIRSVVVDKFTIPRRRVLLTPSMCEVHGCNFDIAVKNGFGEWDNVPRKERKILLEALEAHKQTAHNNSEDYIIDEDKMPTRWLGSERGLKDL